MKHLNLFARTVAALAASVAFAGLAQAQTKTAAGTGVSNTFTLDYKVAGASQTTITNQAGVPGTIQQGTPTVFTVDRLIDLTIDQLNSPLTVAPNSSGNRLIYRLTNEGNDNQRYNLATAVTPTTYTPGGVTIRYFIDTNGNDVLDGGETLVTANAIGADVAPDAKVIVYVDSDVPSTAVNGNTATIRLTATTTYPGTSLEPGFTPSAGTVVTADTDGINTLAGAAENVFAEGPGDGDPTTGYTPNGAFPRNGVLNVVSANLSATKTVVVLEDDPAQSDAACGALTSPVAGAQYSTPDACVLYTISVTNSGAASAGDLNVADFLPAQVRFVKADISATFTSYDPDGAGPQPAVGPTLTTPPPAEVCDGTTTCLVRLNPAALAGSGTVGTIRIWARVK